MCEQMKHKTARNMAGLTRDEAIDENREGHLPISLSTLKRIESGQQRCPKDVEEAMAKLYNAPWVSDPTVPDNYKPLSRAEATLKYINERDDVELLLPRARRILADGIINESERDEFVLFEKEIKEERIAGRDLLYAR